MGSCSKLINGRMRIHTRCDKTYWSEGVEFFHQIIDYALFLLILGSQLSNSGLQRLKLILEMLVLSKDVGLACWEKSIDAWAIHEDI